MSDDKVLRIRIESMICQLSPTFQDSTASKVEYLVQRPARLVESVLESRHFLEQRNVEFQRAFVDVVIDFDGSNGVLNPAQRCGVSGGQTHAQARAVDEVGGQEIAFHHVRLPARIDRQAGGDFARGKPEAPETAANGGADVVQLLRQEPRSGGSQVVIGRRRNDHPDP